MSCSVENCDHEVFHNDKCACHLDLEVFGAMSTERREEAVRVAALENDSFDVDTEGNIRLKDDE